MENAFAVKPRGLPKIIHWDEWPKVIGRIDPTFHYAIGLPPIKLIQEVNKNEGCFVLFRPEFRLKYNGEVVYSVICECEFEIHFLKGILPNENMLYTILEYSYDWFKKEFKNRENRNFEDYAGLIKESILETIRLNMKNNNWV